MDEKKRMNPAAMLAADVTRKRWELLAESSRATETLRTFLVKDSVCSCCQSNQSMYELVARTVSRDRTVDRHSIITICTSCDLGEDD